MTEKEQTDNFANDLDKLVYRYAEEYDLSYAAVVGTLNMKIWTLCQQANE